MRLLASLCAALPLCRGLRRHAWIRPGRARWCENCGALRGARLTYADCEELLIALRSIENFMGSDAEAKLICYLGSADARGITGSASGFYLMGPERSEGSLVSTLNTQEPKHARNKSCKSALFSKDWAPDPGAAHALRPAQRMSSGPDQPLQERRTA